MSEDLLSQGGRAPAAGPSLRGEIITFYSYKGGVGRSMALANVATLMAQAQKKVLVIDFDFEAPGLHRYFAARPAEGAGDQPGMIDFLCELKSQLDLQTKSGRPTSALPPGTQPLTQDQKRRILEQQLARSHAIARTVRKVLDDGGFVRAIRVKDPNQDRAASVDMIAAGRFDPHYAAKIRSFDWQAFYKSHSESLRLLAEELSSRYDYVLLDSRTGLTDIGSICTVVLPEKLVLVFTPNEQSLNGAVEVGREAVEARKRSTDLRPLPLFPLVSRVENAEEALQRAWISDAKSRFEEVFRAVYGLDSCDLTPYFDAVRIPHKSAFAYGEQIATEQQRVAENGSLAAAFYQFTVALQANNVVDAQPQIRSKLIDPSEAQTRAAEAEQRAKEAEARAAQLSKEISQSRRSRRISLLVAIGVVIALAAGIWRLWPNREAQVKACVERELKLAKIPDPTITSAVAGITLKDGAVSLTAGQPLYRAILDPVSRGAFEKCEGKAIGMALPLKAYVQLRVLESGHALANANISEKGGDSCETDQKGSCMVAVSNVGTASSFVFEVHAENYQDQRLEISAVNATDPVTVNLSRRTAETTSDAGAGTGAFDSLKAPLADSWPGSSITAGGAVSDAAAEVAKLRTQFRLCYLRGLASDANLSGSVHLTIRVGANGQVESVTPTEVQGLNATVVNCVASAAKGASFSKPEGGSAVITVPVSFVKH